MLTALAILERELGLIEYEAHKLRRRMAARSARPAVLQEEMRALEKRRAQALALLDDAYEEYEGRARHNPGQHLGDRR
jgi:hypothetical protein